MQTPSGAPGSQNAHRDRLVRYDELLPCTTAFIDTRTPGSALKENFTIIGPGVAENPDQHVHIEEPHGFNIGGARQPPRCVNSQHSHKTAEVFIVHSGTWAFRTGEQGQDGEVILTTGDVISIPTDVFRGFENVGEDTGFLFAVLGGDDPGHVLWAPYVFEAAAEHGLILLENGRLIDTTKGETAPSDQPIQRATTEAMMASLQRIDSTLLEKCVVRTSEFVPAESGLLAREGIAETPIIGQQTSEFPGCTTPPGKIAWPHDFQLKHLKISSDRSTPLYSRPVAEVLFVQEGHAILDLADEQIDLGPGDVFTTPKNMPRAIRNTSDQDVNIYAVLGTDQPTATII